MVNRELKPLIKNSFFLFGARGTGKTTLIEELFSDPKKNITFNLLDPKLADDLLLDPNLLERIVNSPENLKKNVLIDEVQRLPKLLDVVQKLIVKDKRIFILTGSSARRLKQQGVNLLAGRAFVYNLFPFSSWELGPLFDLEKALNRGLLPQSYLAETDNFSDEYLRAYVLTYIEKEIQFEQWVRKIEPFRRFLAVAAQMSGKILNYASISKDVGVDDATIKSYYEILEDTLLGTTLPSFHESVRKAQRVAPKFYLFDFGVKRALDKTLASKVIPQTSTFGEAFEHFFFYELIKKSNYQRLDWSFSYLRTKDDVEIDLIIDRPGKPRALVEVKSKTKITDKDAKALEGLGNSIDPKAEKFLVSLDLRKQKIGKTLALPWNEALTLL